MREPLVEFAPAKVNLALHVTGVTDGGYHLLDSIVAFAGVGDSLEAEPGSGLSLTIDGPFADQLGAGADNLVIRAAEAIRPKGKGAALRLTKRLPIASGIGGGSADAAAALRLLSRMWDVPLPDLRSQLALGADVPVCVEGKACRMQGIGEIITPVSVRPEGWLLLVNPLQQVSTPAIFAALAEKQNPPVTDWEGEPAGEWLAGQRNDLQIPAISLRPVIADLLEALAALPGCRFSRMSGSGATCFGLFGDEGTAREGEAALRAAIPRCWMAAAPILAD